jgi:hypothetical protein
MFVVPTLAVFEYFANRAPSHRGSIESYAWLFLFGLPSSSQLRIGILCRMLGKFRRPF